MLRQLNLFNLRTLLVMLLKIQLCLFRISCVNCAFHTRLPLIQQKQCAFVHKIINQHNPLLRAPHQPAYEGISIPNTACSKQFLS